MKFALAILLLLSPAVLGRRLLQDGCADLSALDAVPEVSDVVTLLKGFNLLPNGIPEGVTVFLPSNTAVQALIDLVAPLVPGGLTVETLPEAINSPVLATLNIEDRLVSALIYHIAPVGAAEPSELVAEGTIPTVLSEVTPGFDLQFAAGPDGNYTITYNKTKPTVANTSDPILACGSAVYVIDKVMTPTDLVDPAFPLTTVAEAQALLAGGGGASAPAPAPEA